MATLPSQIDGEPGIDMDDMANAPLFEETTLYEPCRPLGS
jgi:hypothetical protein